MHTGDKRLVRREQVLEGHQWQLPKHMPATAGKLQTPRAGEENLDLSIIDEKTTESRVNYSMHVLELSF
jgi:hypothetical protein